MTEAKQKKSINEKINVQLMNINVQDKREAQITELMTSYWNLRSSPPPHACSLFLPLIQASKVQAKCKQSVGKFLRHLSIIIWISTTNDIASDRSLLLKPQIYWECARTCARGWELSLKKKRSQFIRFALLPSLCAIMARCKLFVWNMCTTR